MKSMLLATASIVAFAGAASAQQTGVTFGGEVELGFNDEEEDGFFYSADLNVNFEADLGGGLTSTVTFTLPVADDEFGDGDDDAINATDYVLALEAEGIGGLFFGDTATAAETHWDPGFALASDGITEQDNETVLRGDGTFAGFETSLSAIIRDGGNEQPGDLAGADREYVDQISFGASGAVGLFTVNVAYQEESVLSGIAGEEDGDDEDTDGTYDSSNEDFNADEILALSAGATFGGADVKFAFARNFNDIGNDDDDGDEGTNSYGVLVRYPFGPVSVSAAYAFEPDYDENSYEVAAAYESGPIAVGAYYQSEVGDEEYGVEAVYSPSEVTRFALGYIEDIDNEGIDVDGEQDEGIYAQARQAIGENAYVEASYAEFTDAGPDEVREGTTLLVGLTF
jgi:hypothetical protein